jgi:Tol biopolymer transport system component
MIKYILCLFYLQLAIFSSAQLSPLTVEKIMRDPKWIGTSPTSPVWSADGKTLFFQWNPENNFSDSAWYITVDNRIPVKASVHQKTNFISPNEVTYNRLETALTYSQNADIFYKDVKTGKIKRITQTTEAETNPVFSFNDSKIIYTRQQNLYAWDINTGETIQLTNVRTGDQGGKTNTSLSQQEQWLKNEQLQYFQVLKERKQKRDAADAYNRSLSKEKELRTINIEDKIIQRLQVSPDGRFISYRLFKPVSAGKSTVVPSFVTETGFTTDISSRTKVGAPQGNFETFLYDRQKDTIYNLRGDSIPGIQDLPLYLADYPKLSEDKKKKPVNRTVFVNNISWSPSGSFAVADIRSADNKDRWIMMIDTSSGKLKLLDRQHDEAWVGGPGTSGFGNSTGFINENNFWYRSEATGYSHIYIINLLSGEKKQLSSGNYEVQQAQLSKDKKYFYITTNEMHPGEQQFYRLSIADGKNLVFL